MKIENAKKVSIGLFPTPLQYMENLTEKLSSGKLYIKRDDMTDVGMSGNKIRKLEYLIQDAKDKGCNTLLTYGGPQSNHARLTAAAAVKAKMKCILMLSGYRKDYCSGNIVLDQMFGADVYFLGDKCAGNPELQEKLVSEVISEYEANGDKVYSIPIGGSSEVGALGYINMVPEIIKQMVDNNIDAKYLVCGAGSMGTYAGLFIGAKYYNAPFKVIGVSIMPDSPFNKEYVVDYINRSCEYLELDFRCTEEDINIVYETYSGVGYNIPDATTRKYMNLMASTEAIILDPTYTGKVFYGFVDMVEKGIIPKGEAAIMLHTGGMPAIWAKEHLDACQDELWSEGMGKALY